MDDLEENFEVPENFEYILDKNYTFEQKNVYKAFAFKKNNTILLVGCGKWINIYKFYNSKITQQFQRLKEHKEIVVCLHFMIKSNSFISGSKGQLFYWVPHKSHKTKWVLHQRLQENYSQRNFIQMNQFEDLIIQADGDRTVKFWKLQNGSWDLEQIVRTVQSTTIMSLNQTEEKLVTCQIPEKRLPGGQQKFQIQILIKKNEAKWEIAQTIGIWNETFKICFTFWDQFVTSNIKIENTDQGSLEIYDYNQEEDQFKKTRSIKIQKVNECCYFFPCQLIKSQNILILKHGSFINIFKVNNRNEIELRQTIEMNTYQYYGKLTDDGKYLVIWSGLFWGGCWKETIQIWNAIKK